MSCAKTAIVIIALVLSLTATTGLFPFASAFVNIVSPSKGEPVPAGSSLTVSGTSDDNAQFNCKIMVIVNDKRPYQETLPVGPGDYSKWTFVVNPQYAEIEEGINTITSKASCDAPYESFLKLDPLTKEYVKHYSINVTGGTYWSRSWLTRAFCGASTWRRFWRWGRWRRFWRWGRWRNFIR